MQTIKSNLLKLATVLILVAALFGAGFAPVQSVAAACAPSVMKDLWAKPGSAVLYGSTSVNFWGYSDTALGAASLPGPVLDVNQGDCVQVTLHNGLSEASALLFQGQSLVPDTTGAPASGTQVYIFSATDAGTFLYEAGLIPGTQHQVAMGLYGALVVHPSIPSGAFNTEKVIVLSEFDATLAANPVGYDMRKYAPKYFLINGKAYPDTDLPANQISVTGGDNLLLRYVNAGLQAHAMSTLGVAQKAIAVDGLSLTHPHSMVAETIAPGQTLDAIVAVPVLAAAGTKYALYDANLMLRNTNASGLGGMLTFLTVPGTSGGTGGPATTNVALSPNPSNGLSEVTLTATIASGVTAAEYFVDTVGADGTGCAITGSLNSVNVSIPVSGAVSPCTDLATLSSGNHTFYVHGTDGVTWGAVASAVLNLDKVGPATSALSLVPNPTNGTANVSLTGSASDSATGNHNIAVAEYFIDSIGANGSGTSLTVNVAAPTASLSATLTASAINALSSGNHTVSVHSQDALGNWGMFVNITLKVDKAGPLTSSVTAAPGANNGTTPLNTSTPAVRVSATFDDSTTGASNIAAAEGFIDIVGTTGTGFVFVATDGAFNSPSEAGYADVPLPVINSLSNGNHTIYVHSRDAAGNWGGNSTLVYLIDRTSPTFTGVSLAPNPTLGAANVTLTVNGSVDPLVSGLASGVAGGEYWINPPTSTTPAPGSGTQFSGLTANIPVGTLATGTYTVSARIRDTAGNWSTGTNGIRTATLTVVPDAIFSNGFETAAAPWGWSSRSTTNTGRLNRSSASALVGSFGLQAQGNNTNYVQYNFGTAAQPATATFDARFYFRPNGNTSTGKDIFSAATSNTFGTTVFRVRYRLNAGTPQVQIQVGTSNTNTTWTNVLGGTSSNYIEVVWVSGSTLQLYVNGVLSQTLTASSNSVGAVRLGSVTNTGNATLMYFDAFASKRSTSPLIGP